MALIIEERYKVLQSGTVLNRIYSDGGFKVRKESTGELFDEVVIPAGKEETYTESSESIEPTEADKAEAFDILTGVSE